MASDGLQMEVRGVKATQAVFDGMRTASKRRVMRPALRAGASVVLKAMKADVGPGAFKDSSGALRRSLGIKVGLGKQGIFAVVGARANVQRTHKGRTRRPVRYLHLIERDLPFVNASLDENRGSVESAIRKETKKQIEKEVAKLAAKAGRR